MNPTTFHYATIAKPETTEVGSIMATRYSADHRLQGVLWDSGRQIWIYAPAIAGGYLGDPKYIELTTTVSRETAEEVSRGALGTELPSEAELDEICAEGVRMGWRFGPPHDAED